MSEPSAAISAGHTATSTAANSPIRGPPTRRPTSPVSTTVPAPSTAPVSSKARSPSTPTLSTTASRAGHRGGKPAVATARPLWK